jgi:hypothetical protein
MPEKLQREDLKRKKKKKERKKLQVMGGHFKSAV